MQSEQCCSSAAVGAVSVVLPVTVKYGQTSLSGMYFAALSTGALYLVVAEAEWPLAIYIDKLYTQIGNVNRLHNIIEPFAALF